MVYTQIMVGIADGILTLTLNRPEKLNAFTETMMREIIDAFDRADADDEVRAVVVTGAGRAFCAGADLGSGTASFGTSSRPELASIGSPVGEDGVIDWDHEAMRDGGGEVTLRIFKCLKPVIAAINGAAVGIGATLPLAMDIRLASTQAKFGFVFARRGIVPEAASSWFLPRIVGISRALEWCYTGGLLAADEALAGGLVKALSAPEDLLPAAYRLARGIADNSAPVSVALIRQMMWRGLGMEHPMEAHRVDSRAIFARSRSKDLEEGIRSFVEKRPGRFTDTVARDMPEFFPWWDEQTYR